MKYRADIDGLRALAVLPVLFYHADISLFSGGYVGVDIFFVISGYLITSIIIEEINKGTFTIRNFYVRRIKRIFPALFTVLAVVTVLGFFLHMPYEYEKYGKSMVSAVFFVSNIHFNKEMGYFTDLAETKPLLHTWSLSVEEQFYIFFPLFLIFIAKYLRKNYIKYVFSVFVISFAVSSFTVHSDPGDTFYLLPMRAWELFAGALLALKAVPVIKNRSVMNLLGVLGLIMIAVSTVFFTDKTVFPGPSALLPCGGTFLIIYSGIADTSVGKLLSWKPLVGIGLLSYSLYLWHWPLLSFFNDYRPALDISETVAANIRYMILVLSFVLTLLTYKFIEIPFRKLKPVRMEIFFTVTFVVMFAFAGTGEAVQTINGIPGRLPSGVVAIDKGHDEYTKQKGCRDEDIEKFSYDNIRRIGAKNGEPEFIVIGDSHAVGYWPGFDSYGETIGKTGLLVAHNSFPPVKYLRFEGKECNARLMNKTLDIVKERDSIKKVILIGRWTVYTEGCAQSRCFDFFDEKMNKIARPDYPEAVFNALKETVNELSESGKEVYVMSNVPEYHHKIPSVMSKSEMLQSRFGITSLSDIRQTISEYETVQHKAISLMDKIESSTDAVVLRPENVLLQDGRYRVLTNGHSVYMDGNHLAEHGARFIVNKLGNTLFGEN